jgi:superfamily II DNA/RNA helicase
LNNVQTFASLGTGAETISALENAGIITPFPIQELTIPIAIRGLDIIAQAKTGTGKTLAFTIPIVERIKNQQSEPQALVVVPTRELCQQVSEDLTLVAANQNIRVVSIYGGKASDTQIQILKNGVEVVVGTPGRLLDLYRQGFLRLNKIKMLCLDEADQMLDQGFLPDITKLLACIPSTRQTMLFSATMPTEVINLSKQFMNDPIYIRADIGEDYTQTVDLVEQYIYRAHVLDKVEMVSHILQAEGRGASIIFCRTKMGAQRLSEDLLERGFKAGAVHGDMPQHLREKSLASIKNGDIDVLIATDVAARGIDIEAITHVINYECPDNEKTYLHRIGRTGRAGASGIAVTLVDWADVWKWNTISKALDLDKEDPIETYSSSPAIYSDLLIPTSVKGRLVSTAPKSVSNKESSKINKVVNKEKVEIIYTDAPKRTSPSSPKEPRLRKRTRAGQTQ